MRGLRRGLRMGLRMGQQSEGARPATTTRAHHLCDVGLCGASAEKFEIMRKWTPKCRHGSVDTDISLGVTIKPMTDRMCQDFE